MGQKKAFFPKCRINLQQHCKIILTSVRIKANQPETTWSNDWICLSPSFMISIVSSSIALNRYFCSYSSRSKLKEEV